MSSRTKIVVLHMKEIIYTAIFIFLGILLIMLLAIMFSPDKRDSSEEGRYVPGIYTSSISLNNTSLEVEVLVDSNHINAIRFTNLDDSVETVYPLMQPTMEYIAEQIYETQSLENIAYTENSPYTSQMILKAIENALDKGTNNP